MHPQIMPDETGIDGTPWPFREAFMTRRMVMVPELTPELADALEHRSWGDPPTSAICIPVSDDWEKGRLTFLVVGLNTRRPFDTDYDDFMQDIQCVPLLVPFSIGDLRLITLCRCHFLPGPYSSRA